MLLYIFAAIAAVAFGLERLIPARPQPILRRGLATDGLYVVVNLALRVAFTGSIALAIEDAGRDLLPAAAIAVLRDDSLWLQAVAVIVVLDFFFYWMHRAKHRFDWWWRLHVFQDLLTIANSYTKATAWVEKAVDMVKMAIQGNYLGQHPLASEIALVRFPRYHRLG